MIKIYIKSIVLFVIKLFKKNLLHLQLDNYLQKLNNMALNNDRLSPKRRKLNDIKISTLQTSLKDDSLSDITFIVGDETIKGIRSLFAASSNKFKTMLYSDLDQKEFSIENINPEAFKWIKNHIYLNDQTVSLQLIPYLLDAANEFELDSIKSLINDEINDIDSVKDVIEFIISFEYSKLSIKYKNIIFNLLSRCYELLKDYINLLNDDRLLLINNIFIKKILKLISTTPENNYKFIKKYIETNNVNTGEAINLMIQFLDLQNLTKMIEKDKDFSDTEKLHILITAISATNI